jgi:DNA processing protein
MTPQRLSPSELRPGEREHELAAIVALIRAQVLPIYRLSALIDQRGSAVELVQLSEQDRLFVPPNGAHEIIGAVTPEDLGRAMRDVAEWQRRQLDVRSVLDPAYPRNLHEIFDRPPLLFVLGHWDEERDSRSVAVVGTRRPSGDGKRRTQRLSRELVGAGFTVISGLALGIDTAAHTAALEAGGRTVAVMGTGIDRRYPPGNRALADRILGAAGALLSQFFPHQPPTRWSFPLRNVVMSGLALATVVVEAGSTSGARIQARVALQHGRTVFLPRSLVASHEWARRYVTEGAYGTRAIEVAAPEDVIQRLAGERAPTVLLAV